MYIRKFLTAGLAVVGIVGMASAQNLTSPIADQTGGSQTGSMTVSITVQNEARMVVTNKNATNAALFVDADKAGDNLGTVNVKTNYLHWDVTVASAGGLRLTKSSGGIMPSGTKLLARKVCDTCTTNADSLDAAAVKLSVYVGILNSSGTVVSGTYTDITDSLSKANKSVSLAGKIGTKLATETLSLTGGQTGKATIPAAGNIAYDGFAPPTDSDKGLTFCVGGGIGANTKINGPNENGVYVETLTFTLVAGF